MELLDLLPITRNVDHVHIQLAPPTRVRFQLRRTPFSTSNSETANKAQA